MSERKGFVPTITKDGIQGSFLPPEPFLRSTPTEEQVRFGKQVKLALPDEYIQSKTINPVDEIYGKDIKANLVGYASCNILELINSRFSADFPNNRLFVFHKGALININEYKRGFLSENILALQIQDKDGPDNMCFGTARYKLLSLFDSDKFQKSQVYLSRGTKRHPYSITLYGKVTEFFADPNSSIPVLFSKDTEVNEIRKNN